MEEGVFSSASTSLMPFFLPPLPPPLPFLSLSLFWSFWLFSLFLLSDLGTQFRLISWISLANSGSHRRHQLGQLVLVDLHLGFPDTRGRTPLRPVRPSCKPPCRPCGRGMFGGHG